MSKKQKFAEIIEKELRTFVEEKLPQANLSSESTRKAVALHIAQSDSFENELKK